MAHQDQLFKALQDQLAAMSLQMQQQQEFFQRQLAEVKSSVSQSTASTHINQPAKEPKLLSPEKFNGN
jgi:uncharacterized coiled-coil protein SlyX